MKRVRFLAINDMFDSNNEDNDIAPFKNILNDMVAKDTSRKVKSGKMAKAKNGQFINPTYPMGYTKAIENKNKLIIDEYVAEIIKIIFDLYIKGNASMEICRILANDKILTPSAYKASNGHNQYKHIFAGKEEFHKYNWRCEAIRTILSDQTYLGHTVSFKCGTISYKNKRKIDKPKEEWFVCQNTHEAIIDRDSFDIVQSLLKTKRRPKTDKPQAVNEFACIVKCADCGTTLKHRTSIRKNKKSEVVRRFYSCAKYDKCAIHECTSHRIQHKDLHDVVLSQINKYAALTKENKAAMSELLKQSGNQRQTYEFTICKSEYQTGIKRLSQLENLITGLYESHVEGRLNKENFARMMTKYETEQNKLNGRIPELEKIITENENSQDNSTRFLDLIEKYTNISELSAEILAQLIEHISVHEAKIVDGIKTRQIDIYWRFVGNLNSVT